MPPGRHISAPMRMPAQKNIELRMRCLLVDLRRVGQENRKFVWWNVGRRLLYIVGTVEMRVVETRKVDARIVAFDSDAFIEQHSDTHLLEFQEACGLCRDFLERHRLACKSCCKSETYPRVPPHRGRRYDPR